MPQTTKADPAPGETASVKPPPATDPKAVEESTKESVSQPGGYDNDPDDPTNPNEEIERHRQKLRR